MSPLDSFSQPTLLHKTPTLTDTSLGLTIKDDSYHNILPGLFEPYIKDELFQTLYPSLVNNPSNALDRVSQEVTDALGNVTCLSVHAYFTNIFIALQYMTGHLNNDNCLYAVENLSQDI